MPKATGWQSKAAFAPSLRNSTYEYPSVDSGAGVDDSHTSERTLRSTHQLPFTGESVHETPKYDTPPRLGNFAGVQEIDKTAEQNGGGISLRGYFNGLDYLIACALGWEFVGTGGSLSPAFKGSLLGVGESEGVGVSTTASRIYADTPGYFSSDVTGEYLRIPFGSPTVEDSEVRRITATDASGNYVDVSPAFSGAPSATRDFEIAAAFTHLFEMSKLMQIQTGIYGDGIINLRRDGTLAIDKVVSVWAWRGVMINTINFKVDQNGLSIDLGLVAFDLDRASAKNTSSSGWNYSLSPKLVQETIKFAQGVFRIDDYSTGTPLAAADETRISEFNLSIDNKLLTDGRDSVSQYFITEPMRNGIREVKGSFVMPRYDSDAMIDKLRAETLQMSDYIFTGSTIVGASNNSFEFYLRCMKLLNHREEISGAGVVNSRFDFQCIQPSGNPNGMPAETSGSDNSEVMIKTINSNPYNAFLQQDAE